MLVCLTFDTEYWEADNPLIGGKSPHREQRHKQGDLRRAGLYIFSEKPDTISHGGFDCVQTRMSVQKCFVNVVSVCKRVGSTAGVLQLIFEIPDGATLGLLQFSPNTHNPGLYALTAFKQKGVLIITLRHDRRGSGLFVRQWFQRA